VLNYDYVNHSFIHSKQNKNENYKAKKKFFYELKHPKKKNNSEAIERFKNYKIMPYMKHCPFILNYF
jgi:hypothetical protein